MIVPLVAVTVFFVAIALTPSSSSGSPVMMRTTTFSTDRATCPPGPGSASPGWCSTAHSGRAGSADLIATQFQMSFNAVIHLLQLIVLLGPMLGFLISYSACRTLQVSSKNDCCTASSRE